MATQAEIFPDRTISALKSDLIVAIQQSNRGPGIYLSHLRLKPPPLGGQL
jgi:hypothetical protein